jgi:hypothetical protein
MLGAGMFYSVAMAAARKTGRSRLGGQSGPARPACFASEAIAPALLMESHHIMEIAAANVFESCPVWASLWVPM